MTAGGAPLVAIVTPVFNGAEFLAEAMDSVQAQTHPNLVHVVLDNASTDATPAIIDRYRDRRVPVQTTRNAQTLPMGDNWNAALTHIPPEASHFRVLCADDIMAPAFVERTLDLARRHPGVIAVGCALEHRGEKSGSGGWEVDREVFSGVETVRRFFEGTGFVVAHQVLFDARSLALRPRFFEPGMAANDTDALFDLMRHGDWGFVHEELALTRDHAGADTVTTVQRYRLDLCEHLILLERHAEFAFGPKRGREMVRSYRRFYLRQLLKWALSGQRERFDRHIASLRNLMAAGLLTSFADAVLDWPLARLGLAPVWRGYPFADAAAP